MGSVACPRCLGLIAASFESHPDHLTIRLDPLGVRRHTRCFTPPPDGEPLPESWAA